MPISATLAQWQAESDRHVFKLIVSPEFGERMDLRRHTQELMQCMARDLGTPLQWVAIEHFNTEHPHVHIAVRGRDGGGHPLRIAPSYIQRGLRGRAQELATNQLGYRTHEDARIAAERQISQQRFTDIDRTLLRTATVGPEGHRIDVAAVPPRAALQRERRLREIRRLQQLVAMGLATKVGPLSWELGDQVEEALRQMQTSTDRLKSLHRQQATVSDPRLPLVQIQPQDIRRMAGRVIGSGLDEHGGFPYLFLETVDGFVTYLCHDKSIERARQAGLLRSGSYVVLERRPSRGEDGRERARIVITGQGDAESLLRNGAHLSEEARRQSAGRSSLPQAGSYGGWLGRYQAAVARAAEKLVSGGQMRMGPKGYEEPSKHGRSRIGR